MLPMRALRPGGSGGEPAGSGMGSSKQSDLLRFDVELVRSQGGQTGRVALDSRDLSSWGLLAFGFGGLGDGAAWLDQVGMTMDVAQVYRGGRICLTDQTAAVDSMPARSPLLQ